MAPRSRRKEGGRGRAQKPLTQISTLSAVHPLFLSPFQFMVNRLMEHWNLFSEVNTTNEEEGVKVSEIVER